MRAEKKKTKRPICKTNLQIWNFLFLKKLIAENLIAKY